MRSSNRATKRKYGCATELLEIDTKKSTINPNLQQLGSAFTNGCKIESILHQWSNRMLLHVWYKILPDNPSDVANIAFSMGQSLDIVNKILIHLKYLKSYKNDYRINISKFGQLFQLRHGNKKVSIGYSRRKGEKQTYYLCMGVPLFKNHTEQVSI